MSAQNSPLMTTGTDLCRLRLFTRSTRIIGVLHPQRRGLAYPWSSATSVPFAEHPGCCPETLIRADGAAPITPPTVTTPTGLRGIGNRIGLAGGDASLRFSSC